MDNYGDIFAMFAGVGIFLGLIVLAIAVFQIVVTWKVFKKAGKQGWEAIVPIYSTWILNEICGLNWWWFLISISGLLVSILRIPGLSQLTSLASLLANVNMAYNLSKKFNKDNGFFIVLALIPVVGYSMLAFDQNANYDANVTVSSNGFFHESNGTNNTNNSNNNSNTTNTTQAGGKFCHNCGAKLDQGSTFCSSCGTKQD